MRKFLLPLAATIVLTGCGGSATAKRGDVVKESYIHKYGVDVSKDEWNERGQDGRIVTTKQDGVVLTRTYERGVLHGDTTITFPHSRTVETLQTYEEGNIVRQVNHYASGMPAEEERFLANEEKVITTWFESGTPKSVETFQGEFLIKGDYYAQNHEVETRVANGKGTRTIRDAFGQLLSRDTFTNGRLASVTTYHPNGTPKEVTPYNNNLVHGSKKTYLASGEPSTVESWVEGTQDGITLQFRNGEKVAEIPYEDGKPHGTERRFEAGEVVEEITWDNGRQHGPAVTYVEGDERTAWYYNGKLVSKLMYDELKSVTR